MVEPVSMTLGMITAKLVAKVSEKAIERAAEGAVDAGASGGQRVIDWLAKKLKTSRSLDLVREAPDSARSVRGLAEVIDAEIVDDDDRQELEHLLEDVKKTDSGTYMSVIGNYNIQASNSTVQVNWP